MHDQRGSAGTLAGEPAEVADTVFGMLRDPGPGLATVDELAREYAGLDGDPRQAEVVVRDALAELVARGLVHRLDRFVFVSRAGTGALRLLRG
jgi:hypothetical protein